MRYKNGLILLNKNDNKWVNGFLIFFGVLFIMLFAKEEYMFILSCLYFINIGMWLNQKKIRWLI